jgi:lambda repressor-like predicted transcriptional regulator
MTTKGAYSDNIRAECARKGRSGAQLAASIGLSRDAWYRRMKSNGWKAAELALIAQALRVPLSTLTGED